MKSKSLTDKKRSTKTHEIENDSVITTENNVEQAEESPKKKKKLEKETIQSDSVEVKVEEPRKSIFAPQIFWLGLAEPAPVVESTIKEHLETVGEYKEERKEIKTVDVLFNFSVIISVLWC